jgi:DNA-binding LacI/PurR family transcriptional regulator
MPHCAVPRGKSSSRADGGNTPRRITLKTLADQLGLSTASVSIVLNGAPTAKAIPAETQRRIRDAARQVGYRPNSLARSLRHRRSFTIGVLVPEISEGYAVQVMRGIEDRLLQEGYLYFVASHRHRRDLMDEYSALLLDRAVEGFIAVDTPWEKALPVPVVAVSGYKHARGVTRIFLNHERAATLALQHLTQLGHRRVAVIKGQVFSSDTAARWRAIRDAAGTLGLPLDRRLIVQLEGDRPLPELGYGVTQKLLEQSPGFTALFAFNDLSAFGAINALRDGGYHVPTDVSVVGFDDILGAVSHNPPLTTVRQPLVRMGEIAAETLIRRITISPSPPFPAIAVEPELVIRASTARCASVTKHVKRA